jgi:hypothetical protein
MGNSSNKELKTVAPFPDAPSSSPNSIRPPSGSGARFADDGLTRPGSANRPASATRRADDGNRPPSGSGNRRQVAAEGTLETSKSDGVLKPEPAKPRNSFGMPAGFDFNYTEGQARRNLLADCDNECSMITEFLYVSGAKVTMPLFHNSYTFHFIFSYFLRLPALGKHYLSLGSHELLIARLL